MFTFVIHNFACVAVLSFWKLPNVMPVVIVLMPRLHKLMPVHLVLVQNMHKLVAVVTVSMQKPTQHLCYCYTYQPAFSGVLRL